MEELKENLESYRLQLAQIESAILGGQNDDELLSLEAEMKELITLTEESLLSYEKSQLLSLLDDKQEEAVQTSARSPADQGRCTYSQHSEKTQNNVDDLMASFYDDIDAISSNTKPTSSDENKTCSQSTATSTQSSLPVCRSSARIENYEALDNSDSDSEEDTRLNEEFLQTVENYDEITGVRCQAPFMTEWSGSQYHNAMIMDVVNNANDTQSNSEDSILVKVLFLNPTLESMRPCPFYLDGSCRFSSEDCKFSHGHTVNLYDLHKFKEPDFSSFSVNSACLAKHPNGIWQRAILQEILDNHQYTVKFSHQNLTSTFDIDDLYPLPDHDEDSSESEEEDDVVLLNQPESGINDEENNDKLGRWEEYTTGFGSKMLMKYGYKMGDGLGKDRKGRVEPVPVIVLPAGKSLDHCMKLRERKQGIAEASATSGPHRKRHRRTVFHFLNKTLGDKKRSEDYLRKLLPKDSFGIKKAKSKTAPCKIKVELVKNDTKIKQLKEKIRKYKDSVGRNKTKDPKVAKKQQVKLDEALAELKSIQSANCAIELHQKRADTHRKMTRF